MRLYAILSIIALLAVGGAFYSFKQFNAVSPESTESANTEIYYSDPETPTPEPTANIQYQQQAPVKIKCQIFNDVFYYNSQQECSYWQNYWNAKYQAMTGSGTNQGSTQMDVNYNLNLKPQQNNSLNPDFQSYQGSNTYQPNPNDFKTAPVPTVCQKISRPNSMQDVYSCK